MALDGTAEGFSSLKSDSSGCRPEEIQRILGFESVLKKDDTQTDEARGGEAHRAEAAARVGPNTRGKNWGVIHGNIHGIPRAIRARTPV